MTPRIYMARSKYFSLCLFALPHTCAALLTWRPLLSLYLVWMLHFLPPFSTQLENQYLSVPAGLANSVWNSVCLRHTIPWGYDTVGFRQAFGSVLFDHCAVIKSGIRHFTETEWSSRLHRHTLRGSLTPNQSMPPKSFVYKTYSSM